MVMVSSPFSGVVNDAWSGLVAWAHDRLRHVRRPVACIVTASLDERRAADVKRKTSEILPLADVYDFRLVSRSLVLEAQMAETILTRAALERVNRQLLTLNIIQLVCGVGFTVDLLLEFPAPAGWRYLSLEGALHLGSESLIMGLLILGFAIARHAMRTLNGQRDRLDHTLRALRGDFDRILNVRFDGWNLTPAQRDVALLALRGLRLSEIARHRGSAEGTVKAHLGAVFRAADVRTRSELMGLFMEDFLDFAATPSQRPL